MSATGKNYVVDDFTTVYSTAVLVPGTVIESEGNEYRFVKNSDTVAAAVSNIAVFSGTVNMDEITTDTSEGIAQHAAGIVMAAMATGEYGFVQKAGVYGSSIWAGVVSAADVGLGCIVGGDGSLTVHAGEVPSFGVCLNAGTGTNADVAVMLAL